MTNEILSVVLYFVSGVAVTSIVMVILGMRNEIKGLHYKVEEFKFQNETNNTLFREIENLHSELGREMNKVYNHIDLNISEVHQQFGIINDGKQRSIEELYRYVDSRHDKLENKLTDIIKNGCEPVKSK